MIDWLSCQSLLVVLSLSSTDLFWLERRRRADSSIRRWRPPPRSLELVSQWPITFARQSSVATFGLHIGFLRTASKKQEAQLSQWYAFAGGLENTWISFDLNFKVKWLNCEYFGKPTERSSEILSDMVNHIPFNVEIWLILHGFISKIDICDLKLDLPSRSRPSGHNVTIRDAQNR